MRKCWSWLGKATQLGHSQTSELLRRQESTNMGIQHVTQTRILFLSRWNGKFSIPQDYLLILETVRYFKVALKHLDSVILEISIHLESNSYPHLAWGVVFSSLRRNFKRRKLLQTENVEGLVFIYLSRKPYWIVTLYVCLTLETWFHSLFLNLKVY